MINDLIARAATVKGVGRVHRVIDGPNSEPVQRIEVGLK